MSLLNRLAATCYMCAEKSNVCVLPSRGFVSICSPPVSFYLLALLPVSLVSVAFLFTPAAYLCLNSRTPCWGFTVQRRLGPWKLHQQLSLTVTHFLVSDLSVSHWIFDFQSLCSFSALPVKHVTLCRSTERSPAPPPSQVGAAFHNNTSAPANVRVWVCTELKCLQKS